MRIVTLAFLPALACSALAQQPPAVRTVRVVSENADTTRVAMAVEARLKATTRYSVVSEASLAELWIDIVCIRLRAKTGEDMHTYACRYDYTLWNGPFRDEIEGGHLEVASDSDLLNIAEDIFEDFVKATTDVMLNVRKTNWRAAVAVFCSDAENKIVCGADSRK